MYKFPIPQHFNSDTKIGLSAINIFNSFYKYNISSTLQNNKVILDFPSGESDYVRVTYTIPDGFYSSKTFSYLLEKLKYDNYMYTVPSVGKVTYYLNLGISSAQYANTVTTFSVPTTAEPPNGATWTALTGTQRSPIIYFGVKLGILWGFNEESTDYTTGYGSTSLTSLTTNSNITPQINPSQSIVLTCNAIRNGGIAFPSNFLYSLGITASFGALIENPAHEVIYNKALVGSRSELEIKLFDQNMNPMYLLDTNSLIVLSIINPKAHGIP
jgi:hypothetical protein